jgi:hypothetical protein
MKRFIIKAITFFTILLGLAWGLDYIISKGLLEMEDYRFMSWSEMQKGDINADIVIMGNSRGFSHFEPWTIDSICNTTSYCLGLGGYSITVQDLKYHYYRLYNKKPKYIIQQVDYYTLRNDSAPHQHESEQYLPMIYDSRIHDEFLRVGYTNLDIYCPLYRYWGYQMVIKNGLLEFLGVKHYVRDPSRRGHHYEKGEWDGSELARMDTIHAQFNLKGKDYFEQYMRERAEEGIKVILVNSPTYIGANNKTTGLDKVNTYFDSIASVYNTVYWNYNEGYEMCNDTANFCVSVHMNPQATHQFSIDFANDLKAYIDSVSIFE